MDIKNVSCGNLTTGRRGWGEARGASDVARKAQEGRVEKQKRGKREVASWGEGGAGEDVAGTAHENFYDFYALAPAHLEIRFNSLNFKKLPLFSLAPSVDRGS